MKLKKKYNKNGEKTVLRFQKTKKKFNKMNFIIANQFSRREFEYRDRTSLKERLYQVIIASACEYIHIIHTLSKQLDTLCYLR